MIDGMELISSYKQNILYRTSTSQKNFKKEERYKLQQNNCDICHGYILMIIAYIHRTKHDFIPLPR